MYVSYGKFHALSSSVKILKIGVEFKGGNFLGHIVIAF